MDPAVGRQRARMRCQECVQTSYCVSTTVPAPWYAAVQSCMSSVGAPWTTVCAEIPGLHAEGRGGTYKSTSKQTTMLCDHLRKI